MKRYNSLVIGAGPAGMSAALYRARFDLSVAMAEKMTPGRAVTAVGDGAAAANSAYTYLMEQKHA